MKIDLPPDSALQEAGPGDWRTLGGITGEAFAEDPMLNWLMPDTAAITATFLTLAKHVYLPRGHCYLLDGQGAAMWLGPGGKKDLPLLPTAALAARTIARAGPGPIRRALAVDAEMIRRKPKAPHMYLFSIGVRQSARGQGMGGRLLKPVLDACDAAGLPAYLENSNPVNHGFYSAHGFKRLEIFEAAKGAPPLEAMWREAG